MGGFRYHQFVHTSNHYELCLEYILSKIEKIFDMKLQDKYLLNHYDIYTPDELARYINKRVHKILLNPKHHKLLSNYLTKITYLLAKTTSHYYHVHPLRPVNLRDAIKYFNLLCHVNHQDKEKISLVYATFGDF